MTQRLERIFRLRLLLIFLALAAFLVTLFVGSVGTVSLQDAQDINNTVSSAVPHNATVWALTSVIFQNNFRIALLGFIPILGILLLLFIGYNTGLAFAANALLIGAPSGLEPLIITMILPFFFWELAGYALTMMEGIILVRGLIKGNRIERFFAPGHFRDSEIFKALLILVLTAIVLFIAALIESYLIVLLRP